MAWYKEATAGMDIPLRVDVGWSDLTYQVKAGNPPVPKTVIHKSSGILNACEAYAIMGPSGAGRHSISRQAHNCQHCRGIIISV